MLVAYGNPSKESPGLQYSDKGKYSILFNERPEYYDIYLRLI